MDIANRQDFLASLDQFPERNGLEVFAHARRYLIIAMDEVGFDDFRGPDYEVLGRLGQALRDRDSDAALWGLVFIDLWFCSNFGGPHRKKLVARDPANVKFALQAAYWVFAVSSANGGPALAAILNSCGCWRHAEQHVRQEPDGHLRGWWQRSVLPGRS